MALIAKCSTCKKSYTLPYIHGYRSVGTKCPECIRDLRTASDAKQILQKIYGNISFDEELKRFSAKISVETLHQIQEVLGEYD